MSVSEEAQHWGLPRHFSGRTRREKPSMAPADLWPCPLTMPPNPSARDSESTGLGSSSLFLSCRPREALGKMAVSVLKPLPQFPGLSVCWWWRLCSTISFRARARARSCLSHHCLISKPVLCTKTELPHKLGFRFRANFDPLIRTLFCGLRGAFRPPLRNSGYRGWLSLPVTCMRRNINNM